MDWFNVSRRRGIHQRLEPDGEDVHPVTEHTFTFAFTDGSVPDETRHPFYTAVASSPGTAEAAAYTVYLRAQLCHHQFQRDSPSLLTCRLCSIHLRTSEAQTPSRQSGLLDSLRRVFRKSE